MFYLIYFALSVISIVLYGYFNLIYGENSTLSVIFLVLFFVFLALFVWKASKKIFHIIKRHWR